jgi:hypothetical protein
MILQICLYDLLSVLLQSKEAIRLPCQGWYLKTTLWTHARLPSKYYASMTPEAQVVYHTRELCALLGFLRSLRLHPIA